MRVAVKGSLHLALSKRYELLTAQISMRTRLCVYKYLCGALNN